MLALCEFCSIESSECKLMQRSYITYENQKIQTIECLKIFASDFSEMKNSTKICKNCIQQLQNCYIFVKQVEKAQKFLKEQNTNQACANASANSLLHSKKCRTILPKHNSCDTIKIIKTEQPLKKRRVYKCTECTKVFTSYRQCSAHQKFHIEKINTTLNNICDYCCSLHSNAEVLKKHQTELHNNQNYCCLQCNFKPYKSKGQLLKHVSTVHQHNSLLFYCSICAPTTTTKHHVSFPSRNLLEQHFTDNHVSNDVELYMNEEFLDEFLLASTHDNTFQFSDWDALDLHLPEMLLSLQNNEKTPPHVAAFECPKCYLCCIDQKELLQHLACKHHLKLLICNKCESSYNDLETYNTHKANCKQLESSANYNNPHQCPYCDKQFKLKSNLKQHLRIVHSQVKRHICQLCDKQFATLDHLRKHVLSQHQNERKHICHFCAKSFTQLCHLKQHLAIHTIGKTRKCTMCHATFWKKIDLERHIQSKHD